MSNYGATTADLAEPAKYQIDAAVAGRSLSDARRAEFLTNNFFSSANDTVGAELRAAYWLAVARRLGAGPEALTKARALYDDATAFWNVWPSGDKAKIQAIFVDAQQVLAPYASSPQIASVITILAQVGSVARIAAYQHDVRAQSPGPMIVAATRGSVHDAAAVAVRGAELARGLATGEKPPGETDLSWWFKKNGTYLVIGLIGLGALMWLGRPYVGAARQLAGPAAAPVRANPRRRRSRRGRR